MSKPSREPALINPVIAVALEVANEHIEHKMYDVVDVTTRLRAAMCLAEEAGLSTQALVEKEQQVYGCAG